MKPEDKRYYDTFLRTLGTEAPTAGQEAQEQLECEDQYPFWYAMTQYQPARRVGITRKEYLGAFPNQAMTGDVVALL